MKKIILKPQGPSQHIEHAVSRVQDLSGVVAADYIKETGSAVAFAGDTLKKETLEAISAETSCPLTAISEEYL